MFSETIKFLILGLGAESITEILVVLMLCIFTIAIVCRKLNVKPAFTSFTPALLTSLGIFGTFCGIVAGLLEFQISDSNISNDSIFNLLEGMKTAFSTSLVGIFTSILYKLMLSLNWLEPISGRGRARKSSITIHDLHTEMQEQNGWHERLHAAIDEQNNYMQGLLAAIGSGDEKSLTGQLKLMRVDVNDHHNRFVEHINSTTDHHKRFAEYSDNTITHQRLAAERFADQYDHEQRMAKVGDLVASAQQSVEKLQQSVGTEIGSSLVEEIVNLRIESRDGNTATKEHQSRVAGLMEAVQQSVTKLSDNIGELPDSSLSGELQSLRTEAHDYNIQSLQNQDFVKTHHEQHQAHRVFQREQSEKQQQLNVRLAAYMESQEEHNKSTLSSFMDFQTSLWQQLDEVAEALNKAASEQVIEALKQVIREFNDKLTEQFGENFKQLNAAVLALVTWQENYKQQLLQMSEQYSQGVNAITQTEASVANISSNTKAIPEQMQALHQVIEVNQHQIDNLGSHLQAFSDVRDKAVESVPELHKQIDDSLEGMQKASDSLVTGLTKSGENLKKAVVESSEKLISDSKQAHDTLQITANALENNSAQTKQILQDSTTELNGTLITLAKELSTESGKIATQIRDSGVALQQEAQKSHKAFDESLNQMRSQLEQSMQAIASKHNDEANAIFTGLRKQVESTLKDTGVTVTKQVEMLDQSLERELAQVMSEMGRALTSITGRFTEDYSKLVDAMHDVTRR